MSFINHTFAFEQFWEHMKDSRDLEEKKPDEMLPYICLYSQKKIKLHQAFMNSGEKLGSMQNAAENGF